MDNGKKYLSIRWRLLLPLITVFTLSMAAVLVIVLSISSQNMDSLSNDLMNENNEHYAAIVQGNINSALNGVRTLNPVMEKNKESGSTNRESNIEILKQILLQNEKFYGTYTLWEPDAFDGMDSAYAGKDGYDKTGRFIPYIYRDSSGVSVIPLEGYEEEGLGDYYLLPKNTLEEAVLDPFIYNVDGEDMFMTSITSPLVLDGKFVGIVGVDILVDTLIDQIKDVTLFDTGFMFVADSSGSIFYYPSSDIIGQSFLDYLGEDESTLVKKAIEIGEKVGFDAVSALSGKASKYVITPVSIGSKNWLVCSEVPESEIRKATTTSLKFGTGAGIAALLITVLLMLYLVTMMIKPVGKLTKAAEAIQSGEIDDKTKELLASIKSKDEIGLLATSMQQAVGAVERIADDMNFLNAAVGKNDLSVEIDKEKHSGIYREIIVIVEKLVGFLNNIIRGIDTTSQQIADGSEQVSEGAQSIAQGAEEQAGAIEELHASLSSVSEDVKRNAENVNLASEYVRQAVENVIKGNDDMNKLLSAMKDINDSANRISDIIKIIEGIAFQTNILALNASVEAARAGNAGKGFAVVAEEVRNLASKSSDAAKQTAELILNSIRAIQEGSAIAKLTAGTLEDVREKSTKVQAVISEITEASNTQATAISEISEGLDQISTVVQNNTSTSEESAAVSEELSAQAQDLRKDIAKFKLKNKTTQKQAE
jgi:methyl-accepting chemotaxis protein